VNVSIVGHIVWVCFIVVLIVVFMCLWVAIKGCNVERRVIG